MRPYREQQGESAGVGFMAAQGRSRCPDFTLSATGPRRGETVRTVAAHRLGHLGAHEKPGPPPPRPWGRCRAGLLGGFPGHPPPCKHDLCGDTRGPRGQRGERDIASITPQPVVVLGACHHRLALGLVRPVPRGAGHMGDDTLGGRPHAWQRCPRGCGTAASARARV